MRESRLPRVRASELVGRGWLNTGGRSLTLADLRGKIVVLTHEVKVMERCLRDADALWRVRSTTRVFAKGHHPRIYVLDRT